MTNFDQGCLLAQSSSQLAFNAIRERLLLWGCDPDDGWLPDDIANVTQRLISRFYYYYGKSKISQMGLAGWECGLGQILDTRNERIVELLPYLLTAYMFNYRGTKYISEFITKTMPSNWEASLEDDFFFGVKKDSEFIHSVEEGSGPVYGIGKFLSSSLTQTGQYPQKVVNDIASLFFFPADVVIEELPEIYSSTKYVVPQKNIKAFRSRVNRAMKSKHTLFIDVDEDREYRRIVYSELRRAEENVLPEYRRDVYEDIFVCWYYVIKSAFEPKTKKAKPYIGYPPNPKKSFELLQASLQRIPSDSLRKIDDNEIECYLEKRFKYSFSKLNRTDF